jgi:hypothetical protein
MGVEGTAKIDGGDAFDAVDGLLVAMKSNRHNRVAECGHHPQAFRDRGVGEVMNEIG